MASTHRFRQALAKSASPVERTLSPATQTWCVATPLRGSAHRLSEPETRVIVALRANTLALGYSGVRPILAQNVGDDVEIAGVHSR